jgi:hypothetical protein
MNKTKIKQVAERFILRRAFRHGTVSRADIIKALDVSTATATRAISETAARHGDILERRGHGLSPKPLAACPTCASEADLLKHLDAQKNDAASTGLFEEELPLIYVTWTNSLPSRNGTLHKIVKAIQSHKQIDIVYVGLRFNDKPRNRKILPLALEKMNDQWRVVAQDMETTGFPIKVFVLPRIMAASPSSSSKRIPNPYIKGHTDQHIHLKVRLDHRFTDIQQRVLMHELQIIGDGIHIAERSLHEFKRRFTNAPPSEDAVWPPLILKEK